MFCPELRTIQCGARVASLTTSKRNKTKRQLESQGYIVTRIDGSFYIEHLSAVLSVEKVTIEFKIGLLAVVGNIFILWLTRLMNNTYDSKSFSWPVSVVQVILCYVHVMFFFLTAFFCHCKDSPGSGIRQYKTYFNSFALFARFAGAFVCVMTDRACRSRAHEGGPKRSEPGLGGNPSGIADTKLCRLVVSLLSLESL